MNSFEAMKERVYDSIFQHTSDYLNDMLGNDQWGEEMHDLHGVILYSVVEKIWVDMVKKK